MLTTQQMHTKTLFVTLLIGMGIIPLKAWAQATPHLKSRLEKAPAAVTLHGVKMSLTAELWYDQMPSVGSATKKHLLGVLRLVGEGKRLPAVAIDRAWILHQNRLWQCKVERQSSEPNRAAAEFRLLDTPSVEEIPAGAEVTVVARLRLKNKRSWLLKTPTQTVQNVY